MNKFISIICTLCFAMLLSFSVSAQTIKGNGKLKTDVKVLSGFNKVVAQGNFELYLSQEEGECVKIEADENLIDLFQTSVVNGSLFIILSADIKKTSKITVTVAFRDLDDVTLLNQVSLKTSKVLNFDDLILTCADQSRADIEVMASNFVTNFVDGSYAAIKGYSEKLTVNAGDESEILLFDLQTDECIVNASGYSEVSVNAKKTIQPRVSGHSSLYYMGDAKVKNRQFSSSGFIVKRKVGASKK